MANVTGLGQSIDMTTPKRKVRWGILGYAKIAYEHLIPALQRAQNSEFFAISSRDPAKIEECRKKFNPSRCHASYHDLLHDPDVDAVYIPLPNSQHRQWTIEAAEHGKHVLCEKPIAMNAAECRDMIGACAANKVRLMEAFMYRYTHRTRKIQEILRSGELGEIHFISASFRYLIKRPNPVRLKPELGGGALYDVGCYPVNFIGMVADEIARNRTDRVDAVADAPESVKVARFDEDGVDLSFSALLKYPGDLLASLHCGFNTNLRLRAEIVGTKGVLDVPEPFFDNPGHLTLTKHNEPREIPVEESDRYRYEVEDFSDAILQDREPHFKLTETLRNMEILDRLYAAR